MTGSIFQRQVSITVPPLHLTYFWDQLCSRALGPSPVRQVDHKSNKLYMEVTMNHIFPTIPKLSASPSQPPLNQIPDTTIATLSPPEIRGRGMEGKLATWS